MVVFRMWPRGRVLEVLNLSFRTLMILGLALCKVKVTAPTLSAFPGRELNRRAGWYRWLKTVHPCRLAVMEKS